MTVGFARQSVIDVSVGDIVKQGNVVGLSGNSGDKTIAPPSRLKENAITKNLINSLI